MPPSVAELLEQIEAKQEHALLVIRANGFKFTSIGKEPGNWQHLAFTLYSELCEVQHLATRALKQLEEEA